MLTEHSVTYPIPGGNQVITRTIYAPGRDDRDRRILGTEITTEEVWRGYDSSARGRPYTTERCTQTIEFGHISEAQAWMQEMLAAKDVWNVQQRAAVS